MSGDKGISAFPDGDTLLTWVATVTGPDESVYEGMQNSIYSGIRLSNDCNSSSPMFKTILSH